MNAAEIDKITVPDDYDPKFILREIDVKVLNAILDNIEVLLENYKETMEHYRFQDISIICESIDDQHN